MIIKANIYISSFFEIFRNSIFILRKLNDVVKNIYYKNLVFKKYGISKLPTIEISELFPDLHENLDVYTFLSGTSLITDHILLKCLAKKHKNCDYLEIGSWRGESAVNVSSECNSLTLLTLGIDDMKKKGFNQRIIDENGIFTKNNPKIKYIYSDSKLFNFHTLDKKFDLIFVDGEHGFKAVKSDTRNVFSLKKDINSNIVWHDYGYDTEDVRFEVLAAILDGLPEKEHHNLYHISNTMCAVYLKNYSGKTFDTIKPSTADKFFSVEIKVKKPILRK
jgi:Methyltransferase domain